MVKHEQAAQNEDITPEQAVQINAAFDIELHTGRHGMDVFAVGEYSPRLPSQEEYDAVDSMLEGMQPGDALFIEGYGHELQTDEEIDKQAAVYGAMTKQTDNTLPDAFGSMVRLLHQMETTELQGQRDDHAINSWAYAARKARLMGIRVIKADISKDEIVAQGLPGADTLMALTGSLDPADQASAAATHAKREAAAKKTMTNWALRHTPQEGGVQKGRKPKLVVLDGAEHRKALEESFTSSGLVFTSNEMARTPYRERERQQIARKLARTATSATHPRKH
ncbi:MAG TPA: hypothetical protein VLE73_06805 [Candidatus Saccharimonadales bacterium]|nr:hypothetical protein [Candidatus Saccharimonadales bacterium]